MCDSGARNVTRCVLHSVGIFLCGAPESKPSLSVSPNLDPLTHNPGGKSRALGMGVWTRRESRSRIEMQNPALAGKVNLGHLGSSSSSHRHQVHVRTPGKNGKVPSHLITRGRLMIAAHHHVE